MKWYRILMMIFVMMYGTISVMAQEKEMSDSTKIIAAKTIPIQKSVPDYLKVTPIQNNYYNQLGAACKLELNFEKSTKVPLRVRLGSLQQTDYMEQKPNVIKPGR